MCEQGVFIEVALAQEGSSSTATKLLYGQAPDDSSPEGLTHGGRAAHNREAPCSGSD